VRHLGQGWKVKGDSGGDPVRALRWRQAVHRAGGDQPRGAGRDPQRERSRGDAWLIDPARPFAKLQVDAVIESTVAVRNVFGNVAKAHEDVVINRERARPQPQAEPRNLASLARSRARIDLT